MIESHAERLEEAVGDALELEASQRHRFLAKCLADQPELLARAHQLIGHADAIADFLQPPSFSGRLQVADDRPEPRLFLGLTVDERYRVQSHLGSGAFGDAYLCYDAQCGESVVLKVLTRLRDPAQWVARRESSALRRVGSNLVVAHRDFCTALDYPCIVTDYASGLPFPGVRGPVSWDRVRGPLLGLLCAVSHVHDSDIAHGDVTPSNVLVSGDDVRMIDFGLVAGEAIGAPVNPMLRRAGTIAYMSPERLAGEAPSPSADLYAVGVMLFEALVGSLPHSPAQREGLLDRRREGAPAISRNLQDALPAGVVDLLCTLLAAEPRDRPSSAQSVIGELLEFVPGPVSSDVWRTSSLPGRDKPVSLPLISVEDIANSLEGSDKWMQLRTRSAELLHTRSGGNPRALVAELTKWCLSGWLHDDGHTMRVLPAAARMLRMSQARTHSQSNRGARERSPETLLHEGRVSDASDLARWQVESSRESDQASRYEAQRAMFLCALAETSVDGLNLVLSELERDAECAPRQEHLRRLARAAHLVLTGRYAHGLALADFDEFPTDPTLLASAMSIRLMASRGMPFATQRAVLRSCKAAAGDIADGQAIYEQGLGWHWYLQGQPRDAADHHAQATSLASTPNLRLACMLNEADARLDAGQYDVAATIAAHAFDVATATQHTYRQARAEYIGRAARYRASEDLRPDLDLVQAAWAVGNSNQAAMIVLNEAAIAWRAGEHATAARLARDAHRCWSSLGRARPAMLAHALQCVVDPHAITALRGEKMEHHIDGPMWVIAVQAAGLYAMVGLASEQMISSTREALVSRAPLDLDLRREILSFREVSDALT